MWTKYLILTLITYSGPLMAEPWLDTLQKNTYNQLNTYFDLYQKNFVIQKSKELWSFYGDAKANCSEGANGDPSHFRDLVLSYQETIKDGKAIFSFVACEDQNRSMQLEIISNIIKKSSSRKEVWALFESLELKKNEEKRLILWGHPTSANDFTTLIERQKNGVLLDLSIRGNSLVKVIEYPKSSIEVQGHADCFQFKMPQGTSKSCFGGKDLEIRKLWTRQGIQHYSGIDEISFAQFGDLYATGIQPRIQHTLDAYIRYSLQSLPKVNLQQGTQVETEFEQDFKRAYQRLLIGDTTLSLLLLKKNLDKLENKKVLIKEL